MKSALVVGVSGMCLMSHAATEQVDNGYTPEQIDSLMRVFDLNEIVVTGTRTPKMLKDTPVLTRLISEQELRRADATNIQDLLQQELPGVEFSYAMSQQVNMNLSGFSGQNVLMLLDGERLAGETMDNVDFSRLDMSGIARVEIIRGAASAIYGSNASGGVINLISKGADAPWRLNLHARGAGHNEWRYGGSLSLRGRHVSNVLDVSHTSIDTYRVCDDFTDECDYRTVPAQRTWNFIDRLAYRPLQSLQLSARAGYYFKEREYNVDTPDRYRSFNGGLRGEWAIDADQNLELSYSYDQYDKSDYIRTHHVDIRDYSNVQHSLRALYTRAVRGVDQITVGADMMRDYIDTYQFGPGESHHQITADAFAQYDWTPCKAWELIGAVRWDYFSDKNDNDVTAKLAARYRTGALTLRGGYSGGFRTPTLKEKYMRYDMSGIFEIHGNPTLKAERSHNLNLSAEYALGSYYFTLSGNYSFIHNRITTSGLQTDALLQPYVDYINVDYMRVLGIEATARAVWACGVRGSISYNYTHEEAPAPTITPYCPARPHSLTTRWLYTHVWRKGYETEVSINGRFLSDISYVTTRMYEPFEQYTVTNPAYTMWKVQLSQAIKQGVMLTVAVDNVLNYRPKVYYYNTPVTTGANLMIGVNINVEQLF